MSGLVRWLHDGQVGLVGPTTWPDAAANEAAEHVRCHQSLSFDIPYLDMHCVAFRRDLFTQIGPLDEAFGIGMFQDGDYAMRSA